MIPYYAPSGRSQSREAITVLITIFVLLGMTVALAVLVLAPKLLETRIIFDSRPDRPVAFGYGMAWLAVRSVDSDRVIKTLGLLEAEPVNWSGGIGTIYDVQLGASKIYVSPPVEGWTFVVGYSLPQPLGISFADKCTPLLLDLGDVFPEVVYFINDPDLGYFGWAKVTGGRLVRAFAIGDEGIIWNKGKITPEEKELGLDLLTRRQPRGRKKNAIIDAESYPSEAHVFYLAGRWSLDPMQLDGAERQRGSGYIGPAPLRWLPERLRKTG